MNLPSSIATCLSANASFSIYSVVGGEAQPRSSRLSNRFSLSPLLFSSEHLFWKGKRVWNSTVLVIVAVGTSSDNVKNNSLEATEIQANMILQWCLGYWWRCHGWGDFRRLCRGFQTLGSWRNFLLGMRLGSCGWTAMGMLLPGERKSYTSLRNDEYVLNFFFSSILWHFGIDTAYSYPWLSSMLKGIKHDRRAGLNLYAKMILGVWGWKGGCCSLRSGARCTLLLTV